MKTREIERQLKQIEHQLDDLEDEIETLDPEINDAFAYLAEQRQEEWDRLYSEYRELNLAYREARA